MKEGESLNEYLARTLIIVNKMKASGDAIKDGLVVEKILRSMTKEFNYVVCSIEESKNRVSCPLMNCKVACLCMNNEWAPRMKKNIH